MPLAHDETVPAIPFRFFRIESQYFSKEENGKNVCAGKSAADMGSFGAMAHANNTAFDGQ